MELDDQAQIISYEEYTPYGSTSYRAVRSQTETPKPYRYSGKERDEESGLYYHDARYYAPWLGEWVSPDPSPPTFQISLYSFVRSNPVTFVDPNGRAERPALLEWFNRIFTPGVGVAADSVQHLADQRSQLLAAGNTGPESERQLNQLDEEIGAASTSIGLSLAIEFQQAQEGIDRLGSQLTTSEADNTLTAGQLPSVPPSDARAKPQSQAQKVDALPADAKTLPTKSLPGYYPNQPGAVNAKGQLALPADPKVLADYNWSFSSPDTPVLGRLEQTAPYVNNPVPGKVAIGSRPSGSNWTPGVNDAFMEGGIARGKPFKLETPPSNEVLQPQGFNINPKLGQPYSVGGGQGIGPSGGPVLERELLQLTQQGYFYYEGMMIRF
jgi:RHS repeat-associated protein